MRGILLAGGSGTRLWPASLPASKQLLPVFDKPMVYYPLSTLMGAGIREIALITRPDEVHLFRRLLGDGTRFGVSLTYLVQPRPRGIAEAFLIATGFIAGGEDIALALGDNLFYGGAVARHLADPLGRDGARIFGYSVTQPQSYGVLEFDQASQPLRVVEKPENPPSHMAVPGLYRFDNSVTERCQELEPSARGELEITDLNNLYLSEGRMSVCLLGDDTVWLDTGTPNALAEATDFVRAIQERQGKVFACPEEIGWRNGWLSSENLEESAQLFRASDYGTYLSKLLATD